MRTPVILVAGQGDTNAVIGALLRTPGSVVVEHRFDGQVVRRVMMSLQHGVPTTAEVPLELAHGCVSCTIRNDLLVLLRQLHRRDDVERIVVHLAPWLEPEPICCAIDHVRIHVAPGYIDGPAARDVHIEAVITCVDSGAWLTQALGDHELDVGRTVAQVAVGQAEFADLLVLTQPDPVALAVLRRLAPRSRITVGVERLEHTLAHLEHDARRGRSDDPQGRLLAGQPPLHAEGQVTLVEFEARRPFHPQRLHAALDVLLDGVVRTRGRLWLANQPGQAMWLESAGGGLRVSSAGKWLAAMTASEVAYVNPERRAFADLMWDDHYGDHHTAMTVLVCGAEPTDVLDALHGALLTDTEIDTPKDWNDYHDPFGDWHQDPCYDTRGEIMKAILFTAVAGSAVLLASPALADNQGQTPLPPAATPAPAAAPTPTPTATPGPVVSTGGNVSSSNPGSSCSQRLGVRNAPAGPSALDAWSSSSINGWPGDWPGAAPANAAPTTAPSVGCSR
jgi:G3E family GTPase